jgi:hypothetical protein
MVYQTISFAFGEPLLMDGRVKPGYGGEIAIKLFVPLPD